MVGTASPIPVLPVKWEKPCYPNPITNPNLVLCVTRQTSCHCHRVWRVLKSFRAIQVGFMEEVMFVLRFHTWT